MEIIWELRLLFPVGINRTLCLLNHCGLGLSGWLFASRAPGLDHRPFRGSLRTRRDSRLKARTFGLSREMARSFSARSKQTDRAATFHRVCNRAFTGFRWW